MMWTEVAIDALKWTVFEIATLFDHDELIDLLDFFYSTMRLNIMMEV